MLERSYPLHRAPGRVLLGALCFMMLVAGLTLSRSAAAQETAALEDESTLFSPEELEELVGPIALYPDDLVGIVLPASTYPLDIVQAARFLDDYENDRSLQPDEDWDDSVVALLNYPDVLRLMNEDLEWTWDLGEAFLTQQADVLDAVQRFREQARSAGNLASNERQVVREDDGVIEIKPADPKVIYVPYYEPRRVIVHHHEPVYYYPRPYPVYYYPYPANYSFHTGFFWGVTTAFVLGWDTHFLHVHPHVHHAHPYFSHYRRGFYDPFYVRRGVNINIVNVNRSGYVWRPNYRAGVRPNRVAVTRYEGQSRRGYDSRSYNTRSYNTRSYETRSYEGPRNAREGANTATRRSDSAAGSVQRPSADRIANRTADRRAITNGNRSVARTESASPRRSTERAAVPRPGGERNDVQRQNTRASDGANSRGTQRSTATPRITATPRSSALSPYAARNPRVADSVRQADAVRQRSAASTSVRQSAAPARAPSASTSRSPRTAAPTRMASPSTAGRAAPSGAAPSRATAARITAPSRAPAARSAGPSSRNGVGPSSRSGSGNRAASRAFGGGQRR